MAIDSSFEIRSLSPLEIALFLPLLGAVLYLLTTPYYYLAPLPALAIPFLILLDKRTEIGLFLIISLVPFSQYIQLSEQIGFVTVPKVVGLFMGLVLVLQFLSGQRRLESLRSNLWPALLAFLLVCLLAALYADYPQRAFDSIRRLFNGYILFAFVLLLLASGASRRHLEWVIILSVAASAVLSVIGYVFEMPLFAMNLEAESVKRAVGAANDPNFFAAMLIFTLPLLAHQFVTHRGLARLVASALFLLNVSAVILTHSRSGALVMGAVLLLLLLVYFPRLKPRHLGLLILVGATAALVVGVSIPPSFTERMQGVTQPHEDRAIGRRISYLHVGWEAFKADPVLGVGLGGFKEVYAQSHEARQFEKPGKTNKRSAHNTYLELAVGTGSLGLLAFSALSLATLYNFHKARRESLGREDATLANLAQAYQLSFISVLTFFLFLSALYLEYFWLCLAVSQLLWNRARESSQASD